MCWERAFGTFSKKQTSVHHREGEEGVAICAGSLSSASNSAADELSRTGSRRAGFYETAASNARRKRSSFWITPWGMLKAHLDHRAVKCGRDQVFLSRWRPAPSKLNASTIRAIIALMSASLTEKWQSRPPLLTPARSATASSVNSPVSRRGTRDAAASSRRSRQRIARKPWRLGHAWMLKPA